MRWRYGYNLVVLVLFFTAIGAPPQAAHTTERPTESPHRCGPAGLMGWTLNYPFPDRPEERYPRVLIVSKRGRIVRKITGEHYIWNWMFWAGGRQVAYEDGSLHFMMACVLADVATGRELEHVDCFRELPKDAPLWAKTLEASQK